jgi:hypothetical protein
MHGDSVSACKRLRTVTAPPARIADNSQGRPHGRAVVPRKELSMRKALVALATMLAVSTLLAGCGKSGDAPPAGGTATPASPPASAASR